MLKIGPFVIGMKINSQKGCNVCAVFATILKKFADCVLRSMDLLMLETLLSGSTGTIRMEGNAYAAC